MTRDQIAARLGCHNGERSAWIDSIHLIVREAEAAARAEEREACANLCDSEARMHMHLDKNGRSRHIDDAKVAETCAAVIRARGETT